MSVKPVSNNNNMCIDCPLAAQNNSIFALCWNDDNCKECEELEFCESAQDYFALQRVFPTEL